MTFRVLKSTAQNEAARAELDARGLSMPGLAFRRTLPRRIVRKLVDVARGKKRAPVGDRVKSWDVLESVRAIEAHCSERDPVLDLGAWSSELPVALHRAGFRDVHGVDLNPNVLQMAYAKHVQYVVGDMMHAPYASNSFAAVAAMSSMEHGYDADALLAEVHRLLRPGGLFVASTDYWPEKVDTSDVTLYGMSWTIFSTSEIEQFFAKAERAGLVPTGPLDFSVDDACIHVMGKRYTFGWLALTKR